MVELQATRVTDMTGARLWDAQAVQAGMFGGASVVLFGLAFVPGASVVALVALVLAPVFGLAAMVLGLLGARQRWQGYAGRGWAVPGALLGTVVMTVSFVFGATFALLTLLMQLFPWLGITVVS